MPRTTRPARTTRPRPPARPARLSHRRDAMDGLTKTQRLAYERAVTHLRELDYDGDYHFDVRAEVPEAWDTLERDVDVVEKKMQITLRLDESVAKFYRALGPGYQARMNRVLASYAQLKIANVKLADARLAAFREEEKAREAEGG